MSSTPNPIQVQKFLGGLEYPASKDDIVSKAEGAGADGDVLDALRGLPDREYEGPNGISKELGGN